MPINRLFSAKNRKIGDCNHTMRAGPPRRSIAIAIRYEARKYDQDPLTKSAMSFHSHIIIYIFAHSYEKGKINQRKDC